MLGATVVGEYWAFPLQTAVRMAFSSRAQSMACLTLTSSRGFLVTFITMYSTIEMCIRDSINILDGKANQECTCHNHGIIRRRIPLFHVSPSFPQPMPPCTGAGLRRLQAQTIRSSGTFYAILKSMCLPSPIHTLIHAQSSCCLLYTSPALVSPATAVLE